MSRGEGRRAARCLAGTWQGTAGGRYEYEYYGNLATFWKAAQNATEATSKGGGGAGSAPQGCDALNFLVITEL